MARIEWKVNIYIYVYIYIERQDNVREREDNVYIYIYIVTLKYTKYGILTKIVKWEGFETCMFFVLQDD